MDFSQFFNSLQETLGAKLPGILGAVAILFVGWVVAVIVRAVVRKGLGLVGLNERVHSATDSEMDLETGVARGAREWYRERRPDRHPRVGERHGLASHGHRG